MNTKKNKPALIFGKNLARLRNGRHLTQPELAEQIGMTRQMISYLEVKAKNPTMDHIIRIANFFCVPVDELLYDEESKLKKAGPKSILEKQVEQLQKLSKTKQKLVSDMIEALIVKNK